MDDTAKAQAEARTAQAIAEGPCQDFRPDYRERLRWLKETRPEAFARALAAYDTLVSEIAAGGDPLHEWRNYGRRLGELSGAGRIVGIDPTGRSVEASDAPDLLVLHLPDDINVPALPLAVPKHPSDAQKATLDLLVRRKLALE